MGISMKRKWLVIGISITAVVLLVLGSLSNVVGYQSVKSTVNDSPLFQTRTQRATNQQQNIITSDYIGNEKNTLIIPPQASQTEIMQKTIDKIRQMDDDTFHLFIELFIKKIKYERSFKDTNPNDIVKTLVLIKKQSSSYPLLRQEKIQNDWDTTIFTDCYWFPGYWVYVFFMCFLILLIDKLFPTFICPPITLACYSMKIGSNPPLYC
jgi:hypothetical protein